MGGRSVLTSVKEKKKSKILEDAEETLWASSSACRCRVSRLFCQHVFFPLFLAKIEMRGGKTPDVFASAIQRKGWGGGDEGVLDLIGIHEGEGRDIDLKNGSHY